MCLLTHFKVVEKQVRRCDSVKIQMQLALKCVVNKREFYIQSVTVIQAETVVFLNVCARCGALTYDSFAKRDEKLVSKNMHWL